MSDSILSPNLSASYRNINTDPAITSQWRYHLHDLQSGVYDSEVRVFEERYEEGDERTEVGEESGDIRHLLQDPFEGFQCICASLPVPRVPDRLYDVMGQEVYACGREVLYSSRERGIRTLQF